LSEPRIGIIGGTGVGERFAGHKGVEKLYVDTPFGPPSGPILVGKWHDRDVVFVNRHGEGHLMAPSFVPYRANIYALKEMGVTHILASGAVGSLREPIEPGHLVICDQLIDKTFRRAGTFFERDLAVHVELSDPFCPQLRSLLEKCAGEVNMKVHPRGTYVVMEGPQFSTRAESNMHRQWGADLIGMTAMPEARLAREAEICFALIALATDYDCWRPHEETDPKALLSEIIDNLHTAATAATDLIEATIMRLNGAEPATCRCKKALELAIWSDKNKVDAATVSRLSPLLERHFADIAR